MGYRFPAEWEPHRATWLSLPMQNDSWSNLLIEKVYNEFFQLIQLISEGEKVCLNIHSETQIEWIKIKCLELGIREEQIDLYINPTNDCWCRDHGPIYLVHKSKEKILVNWEFNAWGDKYPSFLDNEIPARISESTKVPMVSPGIVMEGGSIEGNGKGTLLTTRACLMNKNRNPELSQQGIERYLMDYFCANQVLWLDDGIVGDDTDGHIDDIARFVDQDKVMMMVEHSKSSPNYMPLRKNLELINQMKPIDGKPLKIIELPSPKLTFQEGEPLPASYANFYICNQYVIVPIFGCDHDEKALEIIQGSFSDRKVIGLNSSAIIQGLGSFHCLTQQEPN